MIREGESQEQYWWRANQQRVRDYETQEDATRSVRC